MLLVIYLVVWYNLFGDNVRVISGKYKGKKLNGFDIDGTRPTMDRVKESLFASIQNYVKDSNVLDLFAGSGSLGIEALSMGSKTCTFVDHNKIVYDILKENTKGIDNCTIIKKDYKDALLDFRNAKTKFDLIILDPPYNLNLINDCLDKIYEYDLLSTSGIIVCEYENEKVESDKFELIKNKKYGSKYVDIFRRL